MLPRVALAFALTLLLAACAATTQPGPVNSQPQQVSSSSAASVVRDSATTLKEMREASPHKILDHWLAEAKAVVIIPGVYRAGFLYSVQGGNGIVVERRSDGNWSSPAFLTMGGAGFGMQAGLERVRLVMVVLEAEALEQILGGGPDFAVNALYDVIGVREQTGPDSRTRNKPVIAFADGLGIMAGVGMHLGGLGQSKSLNAAYHGPELADGKAVLSSGSAPGLEVMELWEALLPARP